MATITKNVALLGWQGLSPSIVSNTEDSSFPAVNMASQRLSIGWRSVAGILTATLDLTHSASVEIGGVALIGTNLSDTATVRVVCSDVAAGGSDKYDSGTIAAIDVTTTVLRTHLPPWGRPLLVVPAATFTAKYVRLLLRDLSNANAYLAASVLIAEKIWQPVKNMQGQFQTSDEWRGEPGSQVALRGFQPVLHAVTTDERRKVLGLANSIMNNRRLLLIPHPLDRPSYASEALWCILEQPPVAVPINSTGDYHSIQLQFKEVDE